MAEMLHLHNVPFMAFLGFKLPNISNAKRSRIFASHYKTGCIMSILIAHGIAGE